MNADEYRDMCTRVLFDLSLAQQAAFDAAVRELRQKREAYQTEERRLLDLRFHCWQAIQKTNRQLGALGCSAPDIIEEMDAARGCANVERQTQPGEQGTN